MPELPEVETVVRSLQPIVTGCRIQDFTCLWPRTLDDFSTTDFINHIKAQTIRAIHRRGKYILLDLDSGHILVHLRMTGKLIFSAVLPSQNPHIRAWFTLEGEQYLYFEDTRKFGRITFRSSLGELDSKLGPEPLSDKFTPELLADILAGTSRQIKPLLLDQSVIAGLGNIYCDEVLWHAAINPRAPGAGISVRKVAVLHSAIVTILTEAIEFQGTTIRDFGFQGERTGNYSSRLQVFGRTGQPCPRCNTAIVKLTVAQRGTHICPHCQKM
ncbi:MAG: DNA-formamidopyrimidine glycosylase [FCB group bacterium]|nr:DNA-formamidopyrimidine glycosylase [FCB group bacterium]